MLVRTRDSVFSSTCDPLTNDILSVRNISTSYCEGSATGDYGEDDGVSIRIGHSNKQHAHASEPMVVSISRRRDK